MVHMTGLSLRTVTQKYVTFEIVSHVSPWQRILCWITRTSSCANYSSPRARRLARRRRSIGSSSSSGGVLAAPVVSTGAAEVGVDGGAPGTPAAGGAAPALVPAGGVTRTVSDGVVCA